MNPSSESNILILASASPRRRDLLNLAGVPHRVQAAEVDETAGLAENAKDYALRMAQTKAQALADKHPRSWILAADTVVVIDGKTLGKPADRDAGRAMLKSLSGRTHEVFSAVALMGPDQAQHKLLARTEVRFRTLDERIIEAYLDTGEPFDKAGAYGIQGQGAMLVKSISGSYTNVVGLPLCETIELLDQVGVYSPFSVQGQQQHAIAGGRG